MKVSLSSFSLDLFHSHAHELPSLPLGVSNGGAAAAEPPLVKPSVATRPPASSTFTLPRGEERERRGRDFALFLDQWGGAQIPHPDWKGRTSSGEDRMK